MSGDALVLGIDVGTESARAVLFDLTGHARAEGSAPYATRYPRPGWAEQDPAEVWRALEHAVRAVLSAVPGAHCGL